MMFAMSSSASLSFAEVILTVRGVLQSAVPNVRSEDDTSMSVSPVWYCATATVTVTFPVGRVSRTTE